MKVSVESKREQARILIVDDEPVGREVLEALLCAQGYELFFAENGPDALSKATAHTPDLVLLDVMMPKMDGFEVCRRLRVDPEHAEVPIIMVTALDDRDSRLKGIEAGADDFITKPFDRTELRARVRSIVRLNRYRHILAERAKFQWVVERAQDGILIVGGRDEVLYANPQARRYLDLSMDTAETIAGSFSRLVCRRYRQEPREMWTAWPTEPRGQTQAPRYLVRPESSSAETFWLQVDVAELLPGMHLVHLNDVTARMAADKQIWSLQAQISHKLRTPLSVLLGYLRILEEDQSLSEAERQTYLSSALQGAVGLQEAIDAVLRYQEVAEQSSHGQCSLGEIAGLVGKIEAGLQLGSIKVSYEYIETPGDIYVPLSPQILEQIFSELCENAKKFHPKHAPTLEVQCASVEEDIRIRVSDDGLTLSPAQLAQIWYPYYQAEKHFTGQASGMGLGLSMVSSLIWGIGGSCRAYNRKEGPGVVVELLLPRQGREDSEPQIAQIGRGD